MAETTNWTEASVRQELRAWLEANWDPNFGLIEWRSKLADSGWGAPHWPKAWYGLDVPVGLLRVVAEEFNRICAVGVASKGSSTLAGITVVTHGSDALRGSVFAPDVDRRGHLVPVV